jgi:uncharacterized protein with HEPN domain
MVHADIVYLRHIMDAISRIGEYLQGINEEEFVRNYLVQDGVIRQLEIIGEATKQISQGTREKHSNIPWKDMAGMRDKLIHDYFGVDVEQVWLTASNDIPTLKIEIEEVVNNLG